MATITSQKEYLKKYLSGGKDRKKKKKREKGKLTETRVKIIDDDIDVINQPLSKEEAEEILGGGEDAPQIVGVIDDRPLHLRIDDYRKSDLWKPIGQGSQNETSSNIGNGPPQLSFHITKKDREENGKLIEKDSSRNINVSETNKLKMGSIKKNIHGISSNRSSPDKDIASAAIRKEQDLSPLRMRKGDEDFSPLRMREKDEDLSPPRVRKRGEDHSPPRMRKKDQDFSPLRMRKRDENHSPPRIRRKNEDLSPPRMRRRDEDLSPPRVKKRDEDLSPPRMKKRDEDHNPPKIRRRDEDISPPRMRRRDEDLSPARVRKRDEDLSPVKMRKRDGDLSPLRLGKRDGDVSPPRAKKGHESKRNVPRKPDLDPFEINNTKKYVIPQKRPTSKVTSDNETKATKTLEGKKAGLQSAQELVKENVAFKEREDKMFKNMDEKVSGRNAAVILRDRKTGKIRDLEKEAEERKEKEKREAENKEQYMKWGKGLKQVEEQNDQINKELYEMSKPLARYADDEDLEKLLKEQEREEDPLLGYIRKKKKKKNVKAGKPEKPMFEGEFMPNRFGIRPGHRWDGVDRSNGYEKKWFDVQNARRAQQEEAFKWSIEDM